MGRLDLIVGAGMHSAMASAAGEGQEGLIEAATDKRLDAISAKMAAGHIEQDLGQDETVAPSARQLTLHGGNRNGLGDGQWRGKVEICR
jgi:hypothetical protein